MVVHIMVELCLVGSLSSRHNKQRLVLGCPALTVSLVESGFGYDPLNNTCFVQIGLQIVVRGKVGSNK